MKKLFIATTLSFYTVFYIIPCIACTPGDIDYFRARVGGLTTNDEYENYKIVVEYKWGAKIYAPREFKARDCGLQIHSVGQDGAVLETWMHSIECNIIEEGTGDILLLGDGDKTFSLTSTAAPEKQEKCYVFQPQGAPVTIKGGRLNWYGRDPEWQDVKGFRGRGDVEKPAGKWNRLECIANKGEITIYLNGTLVNHATDVSPSKGRIQIQSEGAEIFFRKV